MLQKSFPKSYHMMWKSDLIIWFNSSFIGAVRLPRNYTRPFELVWLWNIKAVFTRPLIPFSSQISYALSALPDIIFFVSHILLFLNRITLILYVFGHVIQIVSCLFWLHSVFPKSFCLWLPSSNFFSVCVSDYTTSFSTP